VTYASLPIGSAFTLLFVIERIVFGSQAARAVVHREAELVEATEKA
jgi:TRAP-type C4-dicarboxylate transport system permease small subunit